MIHTGPKVLKVISQKYNNEEIIFFNNIRQKTYQDYEQGSQQAIALPIESRKRFRAYLDDISKIDSKVNLSLLNALLFALNTPVYQSKELFERILNILCRRNPYLIIKKNEWYASFTPQSPGDLAPYVTQTLYTAISLAWVGQTYLECELYFLECLELLRENKHFLASDDRAEYEIFMSQKNAHSASAPTPKLDEDLLRKTPLQRNSSGSPPLPLFHKAVLGRTKSQSPVKQPIAYYLKPQSSSSENESSAPASEAEAHSDDAFEFKTPLDFRKTRLGH